VFAELSADPTLTPACIDGLAAVTATSAARIVPPAPRQPTALVDAVVWFSESHRFSADSGIGRLAGINAGDGEALLAWLRDGAGASVEWIDDPAAVPAAAVLARMDEGYAPYLAAVHAHVGDRRRCSPRSTASACCARCTTGRAAWRRSTSGFRDMHEARSRIGTTRGRRRRGIPAAGDRAEERLRDAALNGDVGICLPDADGELRVVFPDPAGGWREIAPLRLPRHDTAFAMTVHKSQGSEFAKVLVLLPATPVKVTTRELLYTAVTRAAREVVLAGPAPVFVAACASPTVRGSGLIDRMTEAARIG